MSKELLAAMAAEKKTLLTLPTELLQMIFSQIPDFPTLKAFRETNRRLYDMYRAVKDRLRWDVMINEINLSVLPDALILQASIGPDLDSPDLQLKFCECYRSLSSQAERCHGWIWSDWMQLAKVFRPIQYFTDKYIATLKRNPITGEPDEIKIETSERNRVIRALCRFQVYCNLFGFEKTEQRPDVASRRTGFFLQFAPWENEQFACIYQFLWKELSVAFDKVAREDVGYGYFKVKYCCDYMENPWKDRFLSRGLDFLLSVSEAKTYEKRSYLLRSPRTDHEFLYGPLAETPGPVNPVDVLDDTELGRASMIATAVLPEDDLGPFRAWAWAYAELPARAMFYAFAKGDLRDRGYVFFDLDRLEEWNMFDEEFSNPKVRQVDHRAYEAMRVSWAERKNLFERGERGRVRQFECAWAR